MQRINSATRSRQGAPGSTHDNAARAAATLKMVALRVSWWQGALAELQAAVAAGGLQQTGAPGALYGFDIFACDRGEATVFIPVGGSARPSGRVQPLVVPAVELAVIRHTGPHDDVDLAYSALGDYARRHEISVDGALREYYHRFFWDTGDSAQWETELCWPVFRADTEGVDA